MKNNKSVYESIMKDISKSVKKHFNENSYSINVKHSKSIKPNEVEFIVAFNDAVDEEGIPFSVRIFVEYNYIVTVKFYCLYKLDYMTTVTQILQT